MVTYGIAKMSWMLSDTLVSIGQNTNLARNDFPLPAGPVIRIPRAGSIPKDL
jgi:hypothetical protein